MGFISTGMRFSLLPSTPSNAVDTVLRFPSCTRPSHLGTLSLARACPTSNVSVLGQAGGYKIDVDGRKQENQQQT